jgi:Second Messenger Oligonucleotide or Dinucleotide Synthetase domain
MAVGEDFAKFKDGYNIDATLISSISYRYKRITRQLNKDFWNTESDTAHSLYVGSYGRDTAAKGVSDLDIAFELPNSEYHKYNAYQTNGQSALLQAVKRSMQNTYPSSDTSGDGQVVVVEFTDNIKFEVLPVFENKDKQTFTFPNANNGGSWRICNPREEIAAIKKRNDATNGNMKHLARMMRVWRDHCAVPMGGWLIDTLAYQFIETYEHRDKSLYHDWMSRDFFDFVSKQSQTQSYWRAPGSGYNVPRTGVFEYRARSAYLRACEAIQYETSGHSWSARQKWREVYGTLYPS